MKNSSIQQTPRQISSRKHHREWVCRSRKYQITSLIRIFVSAFFSFLSSVALLIIINYPSAFGLHVTATDTLVGIGVYLVFTIPLIFTCIQTLKEYSKRDKRLIHVNFAPDDIYLKKLFWPFSKKLLTKEIKGIQFIRYVTYESNQLALFSMNLQYAPSMGRSTLFLMQFKPIGTFDTCDMRKYNYQRDFIDVVMQWAKS